MPIKNERFEEVLSGYAKFLHDKDIVPVKHQPYMVRHVREFLLFAQGRGGYTFEQTLDLFLADLDQRVGFKPWQIQQASNAIRIYKYQFRGASGDDQNNQDSRRQFLTDEGMLARLREVIRLRHYAKSTETTYLHWNKRFLAYCRRSGCEGEPSASDVKAFLTRLAMVENVSVSTQNQAFSAILLLFREVLRVDGKFADFHALRHTFITNLCKANVSPKTAQALTRHSDISLTMNVYSHVDQDEQAAAIGRLPGV